MAQDDQTTQETRTKEKENLYQAEYLGSGTFRITKPKRDSKKKRLTKVRNPQRRARRVG